jgi:hypothetical protein
MNKILILFFLSFTILFGANKSNWTHTHSYTLKKDEVANVGFSTIESKGADKDSLFFRWTSIVKDRVTILLNSKGYPHQYILYKKRSLDRIKFYLLPDGSNRMEDRSYLLLVLSDINQGKNEVSFDIFIKDDKNRIVVEF